jgi:hypothetical protein
MGPVCLRIHIDHDPPFNGDSEVFGREYFTPDPEAGIPPVLALPVRLLHDAIHAYSYIKKPQIREIGSSSEMQEYIRGSHPALNPVLICLNTLYFTPIFASSGNPIPKDMSPIFCPEASPSRRKIIVKTMDRYILICLFTV